MRVAMVSEHASPLAVLGGVDAGGQNVHVASLSSALAGLGAEVTVYTRRDDPALPEQVHVAPGVVVEHVDAGPRRAVPKDDLLPHMGAFATVLRGRWRLARPDVVHAHFWMSALAATGAAGPLGVPVAVTFHALGTVKRRHQGPADTSPPQRVAIEADIALRADRIVATCRDEVAELRAMGVDHGRVSIVPCGVDLGRFGPEGPVADRTPGVARILVVTRLVERKGVGDVVAAMPGVPGAELVVAGGPPPGEVAADPEGRRLLDLARDLGVAHRVRLLGRVDRSQLPALVRSADVVACVPWYEPFGIVPLEAMASGVPVVGSAVGGLLDTVVDGVTGVLVPPRRPDRVAAALRGLLADPATRRRMGRAGARRARACYGWDRVAAATARVYADLTAGSEPAVPVLRTFAGGRP